MKAAPVMCALESWPSVQQTLVHTGQHYDRNLSDVFFSQLSMPEPDVNLEVGSGSHAMQTAEVMRRFEPVVLERKPDLVLVYGDVNSTVAAALVCSKLLIRVGHVRLDSVLLSYAAGGNHRIVRMARSLFTPSEGHQPSTRGVSAGPWMRLLPSVHAPTHRPANVDDSASLRRILTVLLEVNKQLEVVFPVHPRTRRRIEQFGISTEKLHLLEPLPYIEFLSLQRCAAVVITDSGGIQEETTFLQVPCLTMRKNTERPVTVDMGTNVLVGQDLGLLNSELKRILEGNAKKGSIPPLWDGHAGERIAEVVLALFPGEKLEKA